MLRTTAAFALALVLVPQLAACTPAPSKGAGEKPAASPEATCKHVREVADLDTDDAAVLDQVESECLETLTSIQARYETLTTCVDAAADAAAIRECEKSSPEPKKLLAAAQTGVKVEDLCDHVLTMLKTELGEVANQMGPDELDELRSKCITDAAAQMELKGVEAFNKEAECIMAATNIEALQACGI